VKYYLGAGFFPKRPNFLARLVEKFCQEFATQILLPNGYFRSHNMPLAPKINIRDSVFSNDLGFEKLTNNLSSFYF
ncbi:MAG: hypothetical protein ACK53Y_23190, partial [bacterium]